MSFRAKIKRLCHIVSNQSCFIAWNQWTMPKPLGCVMESKDRSPDIILARSLKWIWCLLRSLRIHTMEGNPEHPIPLAFMILKLSPFQFEAPIGQTDQSWTFPNLPLVSAKTWKNGACELAVDGGPFMAKQLLCFLFLCLCPSGHYKEWCTMQTGGRSLSAS